MTAIDSIHQERKIAILGDLILDETWSVEVKKISPEAPIPVASILSPTPVVTPGGAGLAASYAKLNSIPSFLLSTFSTEGLQTLNNKNINAVCLSDLENAKKIRYIDEVSGYHLVRVETDKVVAEQKLDLELIIDQIKNILVKNSAAALLVLDYNKGFLTNEIICQNIVNITKEIDIPIYIDTRGNPNKFNGAEVIKLNSKEIQSALKKSESSNNQALKKYLNIQLLIETKGKHGASIYFNNTEIHQQAQKSNGIPDVTGCGDVFDINFCYYYYIKRLSLESALEIAVNKATKYAYTAIDERL